MTHIWWRHWYWADYWQFIIVKLLLVCYILDFKQEKTTNGKVKVEKNINDFDEKVDGILVKDETEFICHLCGIHCPSKSSLTNHLQMNCGNVCEICKEILGNKTEVKQHMFLVHKKIKTSFHTVSTRNKFILRLTQFCFRTHS